MIDWRVARYIAARVGGDPAERSPDPALIDAVCVDAELRVRDYTLMVGGPPAPRAEVVSRSEWVHANSLSMGPLLDSAVEGVGGRVGTGRAKPSLALEATITLEAGVVLGVLSRRVLGQYDLPLIRTPDDPAPRLLFVGPNVAAATASFGVPEIDFLRWVAIHEMTHAIQFGSVPWLRGYLGDLAAELLDSLAGDGQSERRPVAEIARAAGARAARTLSGRDPMALILNQQQQQLVGRMQSVMSVIEGHAEHVMDAAGAEAIPTLPKLRAAMSQRRQSPKPMWRLISRLMGMEMKLQQYEQGRRFCDQAALISGVEGLHRVWDSPQSLPSAEEIANPELWTRRVLATV